MAEYERLVVSPAFEEDLKAPTRTPKRKGTSCGKKLSISLLMLVLTAVLFGVFVWLSPRITLAVYVVGTSENEYKNFRDFAGQLIANHEDLSSVGYLVVHNGRCEEFCSVLDSLPVVERLVVTDEIANDPMCAWGTALRSLVLDRVSYFMFMNAEVSGPHTPTFSTWTDLYTSKLGAEVGIVTTVPECVEESQQINANVWATDFLGLESLLQSFTCGGSVVDMSLIAPRAADTVVEDAVCLIDTTSPSSLIFTQTRQGSGKELLLPRKTGSLHVRSNDTYYGTTTGGDGTTTDGTTTGGSTGEDEDEKTGFIGKTFGGTPLESEGVFYAVAAALVVSICLCCCVCVYCLTMRSSTKMPDEYEFSVF